MFGYSEDELMNERKPIDLIAPEYRSMVMESVERRLNGQTKHEHYTIQGIRKDNSLLWMEIHASRLEMDGRSVISGTVLDITERKVAEMALREKDELMSTMGAMAKVGGWEFDARTFQGTWTDEVARIHDMDESDPTCVDFGLSVYVGESRDKIEKAVKDAIELGMPYDLKLEMVNRQGESQAGADDRPSGQGRGPGGQGPWIVPGHH